MSFGELCVLLLVAVVVLGPKELPKYLRKAGQFAGRMRRLAMDMREKSGIDEVLRTEGIDRDIAEIRRLARGEITGMATALRSTADAVRIPGITGPAAARPTPTAPVAQTVAATGQPSQLAPVPQPGSLPQSSPVLDMQREFPPEGADAYGALPDTALVYDGSFPASPLAEDALYMRGEEPPADPALGAGETAPGAPSGESAPATAATGTEG